MPDVEIRDLGWRNYEQRMRDLDGSFVKAGLPEGEDVGSATRKGSHEPVSEMSELVKIMAVHEFGSADNKIPERSFIRSAMDEGEGEINALKAKFAGEVVDGSLQPETALDRLGIKAVSLIRNKMRNLKEPPNADSTVKAKGSSNPLIDTGQARQSIQFVRIKRGAGNDT